MVSGHPDVDVVVVGAGPVGMTLALYLARAGVEVCVLERDAELNDSPRAMVYLHPLLGDLEDLGLLGPMREAAWLDHEGFNLHLPDFGEVISIPNTVLEGINRHPYNVHLGQGVYCSIVADQLSRFPNARVRFGAEVTAVKNADEQAIVTISGGEQISAGWVVGADGGKSIVRSSMGATLDGFTWAERFVATNIRYDFRAHGFKSSNMYVHDEFGCVIAQITPDGLWRCTYQEPRELPECTAGDRIMTHFEKLLGPDAAKQVEVVAYRPYRMHQRLASKLRAGRIVLAGDAAHLTNPTGGLGLTTGLYDVFLLQEALIAVLRREADEKLLDRYAAERSRVFTAVSSPNATNFKRLVYDSHNREELHAAVQGLRDIAGSVDAQRGFLEGLDAVRSPRLTEES